MCGLDRGGRGTADPPLITQNDLPLAEIDSAEYGKIPGGLRKLPGTAHDLGPIDVAGSKQSWNSQGKAVVSASAGNIVSPASVTQEW